MIDERKIAMKSLTSPPKEILYREGKTLSKNGKWQDAIDCFRRIITVFPDDVDSLRELAEMYCSQNDLENSAYYYTNILKIEPDNVQAHVAFSRVRFQQNNLEESAQHLRIALTLQPKSALEHSNLGYILYLQGQMGDAESSCNMAIRLQPDFVDAYCNLGIILIALGRGEEAGRTLRIASELNPKAVLAWTNLAIVYLNEGKVTESIRASRRAIRLNPAMVEAYCNLASALQERMQLNDALRAYNKALKLQPEHRAAQANRLMCLQYIPSLSSRELREAAASFKPEFSRVSSVEACYSKKERLRIGYVSGDFRQHPVGWFLRAVLQAHTIAEFEVYCYDTSNQYDELTSILQADAEHWRSLRSLSDSEAAAQIQEDEIAVLIDLSGHTSGARPGIFQLHPATVQVSWLGYFASTGMDSIDYVFLGHDQAPPGSEAFFHEKLYRLNTCQFIYTPPDYLPSLSQPPHLKNGYITFGCFNNTAKLNKNVLRLWAEILHQVPGSRLILKWRSLLDTDFSSELMTFFRQAGIAENRIELRSASSHQKMLEEYNDIDIALDPFPFSGALTTCEALWMGVPVVTFAQLRPVSLQSKAILNHFGLQELVAQTPDRYLKIATEMANNSSRLISMRTGLRQQMSGRLSGDAITLADELEKAYRSVHHQMRIFNDAPQRALKA
ncbi:tetratricopeptide repeat protein [Desulfosediminicola flagellatus]|uniref:tetratricopeptide repeat protein n=1 Tax=Desulfosediminicola flagellatus TaxID=2569541 RepID=UPI001E50654D|nr:tetratricopeptide repeat protein [Desulfosediminicola flagellatus]